MFFFPPNCAYTYNSVFTRNLYGRYCHVAGEWLIRHSSFVEFSEPIYLTSGNVAFHHPKYAAQDPPAVWEILCPLTRTRMHKSLFFCGFLVKRSEEEKYDLKTMKKKKKTMGTQWELKDQS